MFEYTVLLIILFLMHTLADFVMQDRYHQGKFNHKGWVLPLLDHSWQHSLMTLLGFVVWMILFSAFSTSLFVLAIGLSVVNLIVHFCVDRVKAHPSISRKYVYPSKMYFMFLGFDQYAHIVTTLILGGIFFTYVG